MLTFLLSFSSLFVLDLNSKEAAIPHGRYALEVTVKSAQPKSGLVYAGATGSKVGDIFL